MSGLFGLRGLVWCILAPVLIYVTVLGFLVTFPSYQNGLIFSNGLSKYSKGYISLPQRYGLTNGVTNVRIKTSDGEELGGWYMKALGPNPDKHVSIYFHGNGGTRGQRIRLEIYKDLRRLGDVLTLDYRGFADSTGDPSEEGLFLDSLAIYEHARSLGYEASKMILVGQSLGTAVALRLALYLQDADTRVRGIVMFCPLTDIAEGAWTYPTIPILYPIRVLWPGGIEYLRELMPVKFSNTERITKIKVPFIILHGSEDWIIPSFHGEKLWKIFKESLTVENAEVKSSTSVHGVLEQASTDDFGIRRPVAWYAELMYAGHNNVHCFDRSFELIEQFYEELSGGSTKGIL